jgi:hypothetical protein
MCGQRSGNAFAQDDDHLLGINMEASRAPVPRNA